jgi:nucleotide-binding universal stress UspA family protein
MAPTVCAVDESEAATAAVAAAIDFCREQDAELILLGIVRPMLGVTQPAYGERVRRFRAVEFAVVQAARAAREAGLEPSILMRAGDPARESLREANAIGATEVFLARTRGLLSTTLTGRPRLHVLRVTLRPAARREGERVLAEAA